MTSILTDEDDPASALVAIDPRNGKVRAMAVSVPSGERLQFNLASQGHRQAGQLVQAVHARGGDRARHVALDAASTARRR